MKRRHIVSIFAALALAVGSSVLLTGCAGKSYYFKAVDQPDGTVSYEMVGEITSKVEGQSSVESTVSSTPDTSSETPVSEEPVSETPTESSEETSSAGGDVTTDENTLAVIKFEKPDNWDGEYVCLKVKDSADNNNTPSGQLMELGEDGLYTAAVSKIASSGVEFNNPTMMILSRATINDSQKDVQTDEISITGDKTYGVEQGGSDRRPTFTLVEK